MDRGLILAWELEWAGVTNGLLSAVLLKDDVDK